MLIHSLDQLEAHALVIAQVQDPDLQQPGQVDLLHLDHLQRGLITIALEDQTILALALDHLLTIIQQEVVDEATPLEGIIN